MALCPVCGLLVTGEWCPWHSGGPDCGENWHTVNKIWCDYFHRGVPIVRVDPSDREIIESFVFLSVPTEVSESFTSAEALGGEVA